MIKKDFLSVLVCSLSHFCCINTRTMADTKPLTTWLAKFLGVNLLVKAGISQLQYPAEGDCLHVFKILII